jgi:uncharacterized protein (TIGR03435 family)
MRALALLAALFSAHAQEWTFEVVAIKPTADQNGVVSRGGPGTHIPTTWMCRNMTLKNLIAIAYDTWVEGQLVAPAWTDEFRFDIEAKVPSGAPNGSLQPMLREMLARRFLLKVHSQLKEVQGYELTVAKGRSKLRAPAPDAAPEGPIAEPQPRPEITLDPNGFPAPLPGITGVWIVEDRARGQWRRITTRQLAAELVTWAGRPVEDATGLTGLYDVSLYWVTNSLTESEPSGPNLSEALQNQLGLRLRSRKISIRSIVVDHVDKVPTAN